MNNNSPLSVERDYRLAEVLDAYLAARERGSTPDVDELLASNPDLAADLRECLASLALLRRAENLSVAGDPSTERETASGVLGDFRILRPVGKGGMGIVYEAEQISLRRRVALKVLPFAATMDPRQLQRFHNEAQAAACLHHTNIVPVFSVGCERGIHFYAMQFIDGQPLSEFLRQLGQREQKKPMTEEVPTIAYQATPDDAAPTPPAAAVITPLTGEGWRSSGYFRKVAELGVQAAEALDHAHQLGIVHRDIKPGNLMLDGRGTLWVTDFGLAYVQRSEANLTATGQAVGTPRYMSPEQALAQRAPLDHRTDVYSLGVTLYELLTLRPAFPSENREELLRQIAVEEPARPRRLERAIPAELEIIVLKAMEKRPQDRYGTAQELADDLRRWLLDQPIRARRPGMVQRAAKWGRRHRPLVVAAALSLCLALVLLAISNLIIWHEHEQTREALRKERLHKQEVDALVIQMARVRDKSEAALQCSLQGMDRLLTAFEERSLEEGTEAAALYKIMGEQARKLYRDLLPMETNNSSLRWEVMWAYVRLGNLYALRDEFTEARQAYLWASFNARKCLELPYRGDASAEQADLAVLFSSADQQRRLPRLPASEFRERPAIEKAYHRALAHWRESSPKELGGIHDYRIAVQEVLGKQEKSLQRIHLWERVVEDLPTLNNVRHLLGLYPYERDVLRQDGQLEEKKAVYHHILKHIEKAVHDPVFSASLSAETFAFTRRDEIKPEYAPWFTRTESLAQDLLAFGYDLDELGMPEDAEAAIRASLRCHEELLHQQPDMDHLDHCLCYFGLAQGYLKLGNLQTEPRRRRAEYLTAVRFYTEAFAAAAKPEKDEKRLHVAKAYEAAKPEKVKRRLHLMHYRYNAACAAVVIACGQGEDAARLGNKECAHQRGQALDWLRADLEAWQKMLEMKEGWIPRSPARFSAEQYEWRNEKSIRSMIAGEMQNWLKDDDLAGVRDPAELAQLPESERKEWQKLWDDVKELWLQAQRENQAMGNLKAASRKEWQKLWGRSHRAAGPAPRQGSYGEEV